MMDAGVEKPYEALIKPSEAVIKPSEAVSLRQLTHAEARAEQRLYWSGKTMAERLEAMWELNRRMAAWRGVNLDERDTTWTIRRVPHCGR